MKRWWRNNSGMTGIELLLALGAIAVVTPFVVGGVTAVQDSRQFRADSARQVSAEDKTQLRDSLTAYLRTYSATEHCFARVASIGDLGTYLSALNETPVVVDATKTQGTMAIYQAGIVYIPQPVSQLVQQPGVQFKATLWHELTHHIEANNGDRRSWRVAVGGDTRRDYVERHVEYMEGLLPVFSRLRIFEARVRAGTTSTETLRQMWQNIEQTFAGEIPPSDMSTFSGYSGFNLDLARVKQIYADGECITIPDGVIDGTTSDTTPAEEPAATNANTNTAEPTEEYVIWYATNANIGMAITTKEKYETPTLASSYSGGGRDPEKLVERELFTSTSFPTKAAAVEYACSQFTKVKIWPLGVGIVGSVGESNYPLSNFTCELTE